MVQQNKDQTSSPNKSKRGLREFKNTSAQQAMISESKRSVVDQDTPK